MVMFAVIAYGINTLLIYTLYSFLIYLRSRSETRCNEHIWKCHGTNFGRQCNARAASEKRAAVT